MAWLRPAVDFVHRVAGAEDRPTWCFSVGGVTPHGPMSRRLTALEVRGVEQTFPAAFHAREHRFFGGIVEMKGVPLCGRVFWRLVGGRPGNHRDWPAAEAWAEQIAVQVRRRPNAASQKRE